MAPARSPAIVRPPSSLLTSSITLLYAICLPLHFSLNETDAQSVARWSCPSFPSSPPSNATAVVRSRVVQLDSRKLFDLHPTRTRTQFGAPKDSGPLDGAEGRYRGAEPVVEVELLERHRVGAQEIALVNLLHALQLSARWLTVRVELAACLEDLSG